MDYLRRRVLLAATALAASAVSRSYAQDKPAAREPGSMPRKLRISVRHEPPFIAQPDSQGRTANGPTVVDSRSASAPGPSESRHAIGTATSEQVLRVHEGESVRVAFESPVPMTFRHFALDKNGVDEVRGEARYDAVLAFTIRTRVRGSTVLLDIEPQDIEPFRLDRRQGFTTLQGDLGAWLAVGGAEAPEELGTNSPDGSVRAQTRPATHQRGVWLRVELESASRR